MTGTQTCCDGINAPLLFKDIFVTPLRFPPNFVTACRKHSLVKLIAMLIIRLYNLKCLVSINIIKKSSNGHINKPLWHYLLHILNFKVNTGIYIHVSHHISLLFWLVIFYGTIYIYLCHIEATTPQKLEIMFHWGFYNIVLHYLNLQYNSWLQKYPLKLTYVHLLPSTKHEKDVLVAVSDIAFSPRSFRQTYSAPHIGT